MKDIIENIRIVMIETTHPGNIGAAARAMKTMGQKNLYLVKPKIFPSAEVTVRAAGADDILAKAAVCDTLEEALKECILVVATSARDRSIPWPVYSPNECAIKVIETAHSGNVAVIFGRESSGLTNRELEQCHAMVHIPTNHAFSSLNVASAIQLLCYEIFQEFNKICQDRINTEKKVSMVSAEQMQQFYAHLEQCMIDLDFYNPDKPRQLMRRLKRLFNRAQPDENEMNILRGLLAAAQNVARKKNN